MIEFFKKTIVWAVIFFLLSSFFRLTNLDLIEFKSDEATTIYQIRQFFDTPYLISRGLISGTGVYNFPLFNYLMIPISLGSSNPIVISGVIAFINSCLVVLFFLLVKRYYDFLTAIIATLLLAVAPWGVLFSRKIWSQDLINLLLIPFLFLFHELVLKKNTKIVLPLFLLLTLLVQLHGSGLFLAAATLIILLIYRIHFSFKDALIGGLIALIPSLPFFYFQITSNPSCPDCEAFLRYQQSIRPFDFYNFLRPFQIIGGLGYHFILGKSYADFTSLFPIVNILKYIFTSVIPVILGVSLFVIAKKRSYAFLVIYFISIPIFYFITKTAAYMHYFVIIIPVSIILFSLFISLFIRNTYSFSKSRILKILTIIYFLLFIASNITFLSIFNSFLRNKKIIEGDYGSIYSITQEFVEKEAVEYRNLSYYPQLESYAYIYAHSKDFHSKLGQFFLDKGDKILAEKEFNKIAK